MSLISNFTGYLLLAMALPVPAALPSATLKPAWPSSFAPDLKQHEVLVIDYRTVTRGTRVDPIVDHDYAKAALKQKLRVLTMWSENENSTLARALGVDDIRIEAKPRNTFYSSVNLNPEAALLYPPNVTRAKP